MAPTTLARARQANPYASFWMAGFEGADHVNAHGEDQDLVAATGHVAQLENDYRRCARLGLRTIRESVGWRLSEPQRLTGKIGSHPSRFAFERTLRRADAANRHGLQILWTLMHYGFGPGVDLFADDFFERFADFAAAAARALRGMSDQAPVYTPINEISFLAWAVAETNLIHPYTRESAHRRRLDGAHHDVGWDAKCRLVRAALFAMGAIQAEDPRARFLHVEPLTHVVPPPDAPHLASRAEEISGYQWQAWDMLSGALMPELGGTPTALDLLGVNYYHNCQWEMGTGRRLEWHLGDPRRVSLSSLLRRASKRFERPLMIAETSHVGSGRALWLEDVSEEIETAMRGGVEIQGVCLYPVIDRPDWNNRAHWHNSGLFDNVGCELGPDAMSRHLHLGYAKSLRRAQSRLSNVRVAAKPGPHLIVFSPLRWHFAVRRSGRPWATLTQRYCLLFVEEPVLTTEAAYLEQFSPSTGVRVLRPHTPIEAEGFHRDQLPTLQLLVNTFLTDNLIDTYLVWFDTPLASPLLEYLTPSGIVNDRSPELAFFADASDGVRRISASQRSALLKTAPRDGHGQEKVSPVYQHVPEARVAQHRAFESEMALAGTQEVLDITLACVASGNALRGSTV